jgi:hypothetical protein
VADGEGVLAVLVRLKVRLAREDRLDRLDRAELLNAKVWMDARVGRVVEVEREEMWQRLVELPDGVRNELRLLGMLDL